MHTIDKSSAGAAGVKLIDINTDGRPDVVTAWKDGGLVRVYFNPSRVDSRSEWRYVTVGRVQSPVDAVFADLNGDLAFDVISAGEGGLNIHWAPKDPDRYFEESDWKTEPIPASLKRMQWTAVVPMLPKIIAGGRGPGAEIGWMEVSNDAKWHPLRKAGWIVSIQTVDMDGDGDLDILFSDREGPRAGVYWLENPGGLESWKEHLVGSAGREAMYFDYDGKKDVVVAVQPSEVQIHHRLSKDGSQWSSETIRFPAGLGTANSVRVADIDQDGRADIIYGAVAWMSQADRTLHAISGLKDARFGAIELIDLDGDGDLDILTTETALGLGIIWFENPAR